MVVEGRGENQGNSISVVFLVLGCCICSSCQV